MEQKPEWSDSDTETKSRRGRQPKASQAADPAADEPAAAPPEAKRVYRGEQFIDHDLFKLLPAEMTRNVSYNDQPRWEKFMHGHIYHTVDSNGRKLSECAPVGTHFHVMTVTIGPDGKPQASCSKPMRRVNRKVKGRTVQVTVEVEDDDHTHEVEYRGSERIKIRQYNSEYAKFQQGLADKAPKPIAGIVEG